MSLLFYAAILIKFISLKEKKKKPVGASENGHLNYTCNLQWYALQTYAPDPTGFEEANWKFHLVQDTLNYPVNFTQNRY